MCHSNQRKWESNRRKYSVLDQFIFSQLLQFVCFVRLWYYLSLRKHLVQTLAYIIPGLGRIMFTIKKPLWSSFGIRLKLLQRVLMWLFWSILECKYHVHICTNHTKDVITKAQVGPKRQVQVYLQSSRKYLTGLDCMKWLWHRRITTDQQGEGELLLVKARVKEYYGST